jgi:hypothetical protein
MMFATGFILILFAFLMVYVLEPSLFHFDWKDLLIPVPLSLGLFLCLISALS